MSNDDAYSPGVSETRPKMKKKGQYFGMPKTHTAPIYLRPDDYEQKYPPDRFDGALGPNARIWRVYLDEAQVFDSNMIEGWKDTIDVLLVFAGLFSAVVTTFVVQTSQNLQPDYTKISALLLSELVGLQRAVAEGQTPASVPLSPQNMTSFAVQQSDEWINGLWFTSLALSLATALMSVLVKQWLQHYMMPVSGTSQEQVHVRQFRYTGIKLWHVGGIIGCLPVLMHLALMLFYIGLVVLVIHLNKGIAIAVAIVAGLSYIGYFAANTWAVIDVQCPYKTPLSDFVRQLCELIGSKMHKMLPKIQRVYVYISKKKCCALHPHPAPSVQSISLEKDVTNSIAATLDIEALLWLGMSSSNTSITKIIYHSLAGLNLKKHNATSLILSPTIQQFYSHPSSDLCVKGLTMFHKVIDIFWSDMMIYLTKPYDDNFANMIFERYKFLFRTDNVEEHLVYQVMFKFLIACHQDDEADIQWLFNYLFEISITKSHWFWEKILEFVTHSILHRAKERESKPNQFFKDHVSWFFSRSNFYFKLLAPKFEDSHAPREYLSYYYSEQEYRRSVVKKNFHFLMTHNLKLTSQNKLYCHDPHLHQDCQIMMDIYLVYFENINMWIDFASQEELETLIDNWINYNSSDVACYELYLQLSLLLLNSKKVYNKLHIHQLSSIIERSASFKDETSFRSIFKSLNESFICAFTKKREKMSIHSTMYDSLLIEYYEHCLEILIYSNKSDFWYNHDIISVLSLLPLDQQLWQLANKFITQLLKNVSDLVIPSKFLDWYCQIFKKYLDVNSAYLPIMCNSNMLNLMNNSLQQIIWKDFLITIIERYNHILCKPKSTSRHSDYSRAEYFKELVYLNEMKKKLNVNSTDSQYTLYAYVSGEDIGLLNPLDNMHYAPYSIVFESYHTYSFERRSESKDLEAGLQLKSDKLHFIGLSLKAIGQKILGQDRTSSQKIDTHLLV